MRYLEKRSLGRELMMPRKGRGWWLWISLFLIGMSDVLQSCIPGMRARNPTTREGKCAAGGGHGLAAPTGIMMVRLRGGMGRITRTEIEDRPSQSMSERVMNMGVEEMKRLGRYLA